MNKDQEIAALIEWVRMAAEKGQSFVETEAPLVASEILAWNFWCGMMMMSVPIIASLVVIFCSVRLYDACCKNEEIGRPPEYLFTVLVSLICLIATLPAFAGATTVIKTVAAPRLVIIDYIKSQR